jgi:hypothetical protein
MILCVAALTACQSTRLGVHVRTPGEVDASGTNVTLVVDHEPVCDGGVLFFGRTDAAGTLAVQTPACGSARLVVARPGRRTEIREVDTCEVRSLDVTLWPQAEAPPPSHPCASAAQAFMVAWVGRDDTEAARLWVDARGYAGHALGPASSRPWLAQVTEARVEDGVCSARAIELYDTGCELGWDLELVEAEGGWRIRALTLQTHAS